MSTEMSNVGLSGQVKNEYTPPPVYNKPQENDLQKLDWTDKIAQTMNKFVSEKGGSNIVDCILNFGGNLLQAAGLGFVQDFFNKRSMKSQEYSNIRAEGRANAEYDRRLADMREYNDPSAVSQRLLKAGVNPLSAFVTGGFQHSPSVSGPSPTGVSGQSNSLGGLSGLASLMQTPSKINLNESKTENTDVDTILKNWDILLKDQLWNYNNVANPILLEKAGQELANLQQTYRNLVSTEGLQKAQTSEVYKKMQKMEEEILLLIFQQALTQEQTAVEEQKWRKLVEEITGQQIENKTNKRIWEDLYDSGEFKKKTIAERKRIQALANQAMAEFDVYARKYHIFGTEDGKNVMQAFMIFAEMLL